MICTETGERGSTTSLKFAPFMFATRALIEVMRWHGAFLGQEFPMPPAGKGRSRQTKAEDERYLGRSSVTLFTAEEGPREVKCKAWQRLCAKYCLSWTSETVRADVEAVLLETF